LLQGSRTAHTRPQPHVSSRNKRPNMRQGLWGEIKRRMSNKVSKSLSSREPAFSHAAAISFFARSKNTYLVEQMQGGGSVEQGTRLLHLLALAAPSTRQRLQSAHQQSRAILRKQGCRWNCISTECQLAVGKPLSLI